MKFKIDDNLPVEIAENLGLLGHDAMTVDEQGMAGLEDGPLMVHVENESRVFMAIDKGIANIQVYPPVRVSLWSAYASIVT